MYVLFSAAFSTDEEGKVGVLCSVVEDSQPGEAKLLPAWTGAHLSPTCSPGHLLLSSLRQRIVKALQERLPLAGRLRLPGETPWIIFLQDLQVPLTELVVHESR